MQDFLKHPIVKGYIAANQFGELLEKKFQIVGPGEVIYSMLVREKHLATPIAAHGGSIAALMDATMGVAALSQVIEENKVVSTIEMKISFLAPAKLGDDLKGTAKIIKSGRRILFVEGLIENQDGKKIAVATGTFNAYPMEKAGFYGS
mmetsp:Transcript_26681/g.35707  ORF Transcript_26681/g.35707 Transcript_26681/m.35707 type:complete len:148 (-) Transcript_26681:78-521(-)